MALPGAALGLQATGGAIHLGLITAPSSHPDSAFSHKVSPTASSPLSHWTFPLPRHPNPHQNPFQQPQFPQDSHTLFNHSPTTLGHFISPSPCT